MKTLTLPQGDLTGIPTTSAEWQLYCGVRGAGNAARGMTVALNRSIREFAKLIKARKGATISPTIKEIEKALADAYKAHLDKAENKYASQGAADSEPIFVGRHNLLRAASLVLYGDTDTLRDEHGFDTWSF